MRTIRVARWPQERALIERIDTSFETDRIYRVVADEAGFRVIEEMIDPPISKRYDLDDAEADDGLNIVAEDGAALIGFGSIAIQSWNGRACIRHLYVDRASRKTGTGRALLDTLDAWARDAGARQLWVETQNVNHPAIGFYRRMGFRVCGLDDSLYDPLELPSEVAIFMSREISENE